MKIPPKNPVFSRSKLISLWDMIQFHARDFVILLEELDTSILFIRDEVRTLPSRTTTEAEKQRFRDLARRLCNECHKYDLRDAADRADLLYRRLTEDLNQSRPSPAPPRAFSALDEDFREIHHCIGEGLMAIQFIIVERSKADFWERDELFGAAVNSAFASARLDIKEAGNCLALELNTAAVFHLMRVVELSLRGLAGHLECNFPFPVQYSTWAEVLREIDEKLNKTKGYDQG